FVLCVNTPVAGESLTCLTVYREGGAPAVFQSPKCPRWTLSNFKAQTNRRFGSPSPACQSATLQGRRNSQEDRTLCVFDLRIPFPGPKGAKEVKVGLMAVFDGHNGSEASEMASELLLEYFILHTYFLLDSTYSILARKLIRQFKVSLSSILDGSLAFELLREALLRAIHDIDTAFSKELTNDHHPDRDDEKSRVESAGGNISKWAGVARINGQLAVSRAIGDVHYKSFGVISVPEVTDWQPLIANDSYVIAASDGVFEKLSPQGVCDILWEPLSHFTMTPELNSSCSYSLSECIVNTAFERGSMDNLAAIVIPVEGKHNNYGCFYLSENLDVNDDYTFWVHKDDRESVSDLSPALTGAYQFPWGGPLDVYNDQNFCVHFGIYIDEDKDHCMNSDGFARFLGLLQSVPFHNTVHHEHVTSDTRYILKKKFDRGAYGEVWLAFNWNCSQVGKDLKMTHENVLYRNERWRAYDDNIATNVNAEDCHIGNSNDNMFILKRIMVERGIGAYLSGLREKYFGEMFLNASNSLQGLSTSGDTDFVWKISQCNAHGFTNVSESVKQEIEEPLDPEDVIFREKGLHGAAYEEGLNHIARYVESFESRANEIWLVFYHEGISLSKLLYTAEEVVTDAEREGNDHGKRVQILHPSKWWNWLKTTEAGQEEFRNIIWQLLMALKSCHDRNITHRDIKPENMVICFEDQHSGSCLRGSPNGAHNYTTKMRIIDFGSAVNDFTVKHLYGSVGPSSAEQTSAYSPPEAFLNVSWYRGPSSVTTKYDMWSVGVVMLELILGSPNVFQINSITQALLDQHLKGWNDSLKELAYKLRALMEMCILIPGVSSKLHQNWSTKSSSSPVPWKCSEEYFSHQIQSRDPLKLGFPNIWALRLVRDLLRWDPEERIGVDDALRHPYFSPPPNKSAHAQV
ncbi:hypothetical protein MIMGU_mgv1a024497mg, partial [Erythranthe guttata]